MKIKNMQVEELKEEFNKLQLKFGEKLLDPIYGAGCIRNPKICFIFMNPTAKNVSCQKDWKGLKAPWIGTKNIWKLFTKTNLISKNLENEINKRKSKDWTEDFAFEIYKEIENNCIYITNLAKCTQIDARALKNEVFKNYLDLMKREVEIINPQKIVTFGNQVSSILLNQNISISKIRKQSFDLLINTKIYKTYPLFYPIGQGMRNIDKTIEDLKWIIS